MIKIQDMGLFQYKEFERFLPKPIKEEMDGELFGIKSTIPLYEMDLLHLGNDQAQIESLMQFHWQQLYEKMVYKIAELTTGKKDYFVTRFIPKMYSDPKYEWGGITLELMVDCFVAPTRNIIIPEIVYERVGDYTRIKEWRCGYCKSPNEMKERHCTQCGSPRALLIQEI